LGQGLLKGDLPGQLSAELRWANDSIHVLRAFSRAIDQGKDGASVEGKFEVEAFRPGQLAQAPQGLAKAILVERIIRHYD
jgi:hypothetical protein